MRSRKWNQIIHVGLVFAGTGVVLTVFGRDLVRNDTVQVPGFELGVWLALLGLAVASPIPLPRRRTEASLVPAVEFAAIFALDPAVACALSTLWGVFSVVSKRWSSDVLLAFGSAVLPVGCAGLIHRAVEGQVALTADTAASFWLPVVQVAVGYLGVRHGLAIACDLLRKPPTSTGFSKEFVDRLIWDAVLLPCAVLLAVVHLRSGIVGASLFFIPLILGRHFGRVWTHAKVAQLEAVRKLMAAIDASDPFTRGHAYRVSKMCVAIGRRLGLSPEELTTLEYASLLHDIGRTAIQREILLKPGELESAERDILRTHPRLGRDMIAAIGFMPQAAEIVYAHHEQPDGRGYPEGIAGTAIPVGSRIIMVVAAFDAMTSDRPYRQGMETAVAFEELLVRGSRQFFPDVVQALIELFADGGLFEEFAPEVLEEHRRGEGSSRAVEEFMRRRRIEPPDPGAVRSTHDRSDPEPLFLAEDVESSTALEEHVLPLPSMQCNLVVAGSSDIGCVRDTNEDAWGVFPDGGGDGCLLIVADGMGGEVGGEVASRLAVETVRASFVRDDAAGVEAALRESINLANNVIWSQANEESLLDGMGATCVAASVCGNTMTVAHVGDSRGYLVKSGKIEQLTRDHNLAEEFLVAGRRGPVGAQHILTRVLGGKAIVEIDVTPTYTLEEGDVVLLCSDGLFDLVTPEEILEAVREDRPASACRDLIAKALRRGGSDNVTVVVARVESA